MKIGYPCINLSLNCRSSKTFRLASYSEQRFRETVTNNLDCLLRILQYNARKNIRFFRITSDLIPFASHNVCSVPWQKEFGDTFNNIGAFVKQESMRICMHPDQFVLINSHAGEIFDRSVKELIYHAEVLDLLGTQTDAKIQIHVGGVYGDKKKSMERFASRFKQLPFSVKRRLVIENDERLYAVKDCLALSRVVDIPVVFDVFHFSLNNGGETIRDTFKSVALSWRKKDGLPIVDYSSQEKGKRPGTHASQINVKKFRTFLRDMDGFDCDIMLEIKNKEQSAMKAARIASEMRLIKYQKKSTSGEGK